LSVAGHRVMTAVRACFLVGVNTPNRLTRDVSPSRERVALHDALQLSWSDIERLVTNAISSGFAPLTERQHIIDNIVAPAYSSLANG
ncbi:MAG: adenosine deaminase, partial [Actinomycetota bacterium]|nr:adenosine deaminase [Actinomycetota bacterium]